VGYEVQRIPCFVDRHMNMQLDKFEEYIDGTFLSGATTMYFMFVGVEEEEGNGDEQPSQLVESWSSSSDLIRGYNMISRCNYASMEYFNSEAINVCPCILIIYI